MAVIIFNKRTGKYLRKHSGSYRACVLNWKWKKNNSKLVEEKFGKNPPWTQNERERRRCREYERDVHKFSIDQVCDAEPEEARVYHSESSACGSVGRGKWRKGRTKDEPKYILPDYFESHEIKQVAVCIMRPDGSSNCDDDS